MITVHFLNVGQGNMAVIIFADNQVVVYDCNITDDNKGSVFGYLKKIMPKKGIDIFINSHREADHMKGIKKLHEAYPIGTLWDSGVSGNTEATEYKEYMELRRKITVHEVGPNQHWKAKPNLRIINGKREDITDVNAQSIVIHLNNNGASVVLAGDTDARVWKDYIMPESANSIKSSILLASHHGSITFFDDPSDENNYYTEHIKKINPAMTIIPVGENPHGHPDEKAVELYERYSTGSSQGNKVFRTDINGNMKLELTDDGGWSLSQKQ